MSNAHSIGEALPVELEKSTFAGRTKILGFWLFLGGETVLFGTLFATFISLRNDVNGGPTGATLFHLNTVAISTFILLTSSLFSVMAMIAMHRSQLKAMLTWFGLTIICGLAFLFMEISEFRDYVAEGHTFTGSAFGTSFYTLVGFHGCHVAFGVIWIGVLMYQGMKKGLTQVTTPKFYVASLYWHFVDLVWVFIFTVVYLMGKVV